MGHQTTGLLILVIVPIKYDRSKPIKGRNTTLDTHQSLHWLAKASRSLWRAFEGIGDCEGGGDFIRFPPRGRLLNEGEVGERVGDMDKTEKGEVAKSFELSPAWMEMGGGR